MMEIAARRVKKACQERQAIKVLKAHQATLVTMVKMARKEPVVKKATTAFPVFKVRCDDDYDNMNE